MPVHSKLSLTVFRLLSLLGIGTLWSPAAFTQDQPPWSAAAPPSTSGMADIQLPSSISDAQAAQSSDVPFPWPAELVSASLDESAESHLTERGPDSQTHYNAPPLPASESTSTLRLEVIEPLAEGEIFTAQPATNVPSPFVPTHHLPVDDGENQPSEILFGEWLGYNPTRGDTTWLWGNADEFGMFSTEAFPTLEIGETASLMLGSGIHWLNGPVATDMPARLYDLQMAYQLRHQFHSNVMLDAKFGVGVFSDFEGSARKGVRFPGHAIGYFEWDAWFVTVLGAEFLDRDDVSVLPVAGCVWRPTEDLVAELIFPRPRLQFRIRDDRAVYVSGELGGGTWAIERVDGTNDNATYRDLRLMLGAMEFGQKAEETALEIGWAFSRSLAYRSGIGDYHMDDSFILRFRQHY